MPALLRRIAHAASSRRPGHGSHRALRFIATVLAICTVLAATPGGAIAQRQDGAAILVYHRFGPVAASTTVSDAALDEQLAWLASHARVAPLRSVIGALHAGMSSADRPCVAITADDGHRSVYTDLYPRIRRYRLPVTLFIYPSAISNASYALTWAQLQEMTESGLVDVQSHTYWHPNFKQEKARRSPADYRDFVAMQLSRSKQVLEARIGRPVDMLAWPFAIHDDELEAAAARAGYTAGFLLSNQVARPGTDMLALPRVWMSDGDRGARLAAVIQAACAANAGQ
ncbi:MAG: polysaccharide deacetylase family protein [Acetobacteraceae bacterium]